MIYEEINEEEEQLLELIEEIALELPLEELNLEEDET